MAVLLILTGLTMMSVDLITKESTSSQKTQPPGRQPIFQTDDEWFNPTQRTGVALILSGLLAALVHFLVALVMTNRHNWARVRRTFAGWRFAIHGVIVLVCTSSLIVLVLQKKAFEDDNFRAMKAFFAVLIIWFPSWLLHLGLLKIYSLASRPERPPTVLREVE
jgi:hypothetical protein